MYDSQHELYSFAVKRLNQTAYSNTELILDGNGWYDSEHMEMLYTYYKKLIDTRGMLKKVATGADKMNLNKEIKKTIHILDGAYI